MCNLYSMTAARQAVARLFRVPHNRAAVLEPLEAIFPGHLAPVVRRAEDGERELVPMSWGFVLPQPAKAPQRVGARPGSPSIKRVTNVRDDKVLASPFWRDSFELRRCLVPATAFCEPREVKPATWHWFARQGDEPRPLFAFPGIWRRWHGPVKKDGPVVEIDVYAFMTTTPNSLVSTINHERMPVLLDDEAQFEAWLTGSAAEAFALVREYPPERMHIVQAGFEKKDWLGAAPEPQARLL